MGLFTRAVVYVGLPAGSRAAARDHHREDRGRRRSAPGAITVSGSAWREATRRIDAEYEVLGPDRIAPVARPQGEPPDAPKGTRTSEVEARPPIFEIDTWQGGRG